MKTPTYTTVRVSMETARRLWTESTQRKIAGRPDYTHGDIIAECIRAHLGDRHGSRKR